MGSARILEKKKESVDALAEIFNSNGVYLFDYRGLKVSEMGSLRRRIKALGANIKVVKNRLAIKYFEKVASGQMAVGRELFQGPLALAYSNEKFVETAKVLVEFEKESKKIRIMSGFIEKRLVSDKQVLEVATLPGKEQLLAQLVYSIGMPLRRFGSALSSPLTHVVILLKNLQDKKEKEKGGNG
ncbi:MAG: 50S ribosomal protein L10 [Candidatus Aminicenantes bacterium]|nr:50S ribosomal protein L10 [Candidatus Aminicenantes bacterium]